MFVRFSSEGVRILKVATSFYGERYKWKRPYLFPIIPEHRLRKKKTSMTRGTCRHRQTDRHAGIPTHVEVQQSKAKRHSCHGSICVFLCLSNFSLIHFLYLYCLCNVQLLYCMLTFWSVYYQLTAELIYNVWKHWIFHMTITALWWRLWVILCCNRYCESVMCIVSDLSATVVAFVVYSLTSEVSDTWLLCCMPVAHNVFLWICKNYK